VPDDETIRTITHGHRIVETAVRDFILLFVSIVYQAMPFVILGAIIAGVVEELTPHRAFAFVVSLGVGGLGLILSGKLGGSADREMLVWGARALSVVAGGGLFYVLVHTKPFFDAFLSHLGENRTLGIAMSCLLGLVIPMCECGIIPVTRRLLRKGLPVSCCVAYILSGPIINVVVLLSTYVAFYRYAPVDMGEGWMMALRAGLGFLVAFGTGLIVERSYRKYGDELLTPLVRQRPAADQSFDQAESRPLGQRLGKISETALHDFVDITVFLIMGALFTAFLGMLVSKSTVTELSEGFPVMTIAVMMLLAVVLCLCSEADAFVAASYNTLPAAKLSFLVLGPMLDIKLFLMYRTMFRARLIWTIFSAVAAQVFVYSVITHYVWTAVAPHYLADRPPGAETKGP